MMNRASRNTLVTLSALALIWVCEASLSLVHGQEIPRPNIVVFLVDDMGIMDTSVPFLTDASGTPERHPLNDLYQTPSMERLAAQGIRFNQFCAMSVCSPTRISIMTGQNAARHRTTNWINPQQNNRGPHGPQAWNWRGLNGQSITLPRLLRDAGYRTIHVGKGHFGPTGSAGSDPTNIGFDVNIGGTSAGQPGNYYGDSGYGVPGLEQYHGTGTFLTRALTQEALKEVDEAIEREQPFYLNFAHYAVHAPFSSDPRFADHYVDSGKSPQAQAFATLIEGMDESLGQLLDHLQARGVADETLIIFLGDNGSDAPLGGPHVVACAAPLRGKKGSHYEGGMRVPMIAAWAHVDDQQSLQQLLPIPQGAIQTQQASVCDLFPTILELASVEIPTGHIVDGFRLQTLLQGQADESRPEQFLMHYPHSPHRSDYFTVLRSGEWKVVYHYLPTAERPARYELFHLTVDPYEQSDLASSEPEELKRMMALLVEQLEAHGALLPIDDEGNELQVVVPE